ncbi:hypothetical protein [Dongshaea marina]|uniref:hypothetical protein n=1 Tax=Dongshaea marina TaxID=2047966 RepID=UPI000D3E8156|nr:hypothetical protein [Dongshaea marina]
MKLKLVVASLCLVASSAFAGGHYNVIISCTKDGVSGACNTGKSAKDITHIAVRQTCSSGWDTTHNNMAYDPSIGSIQETHAMSLCKKSPVDGRRTFAHDQVTITFKDKSTQDLGSFGHVADYITNITLEQKNGEWQNVTNYSSSIGG